MGYARRAIAVTNQKGGVGKTTTAINLAACLADRGSRTLLVDLDPQGNASTGLNAKRMKGNGAYDLFNDWRSAVIEQTAIPGLSIIPASINLAGVELELAADPDRAARLQPALISVSGDGFDHIILDCPPSFGVLTLNAMVAAQSLLIPLQCEYFALEGLAQLQHTVTSVKARYNRHLSIGGIVLTMYDRRNSLSELVAADVRAFFGDLVFQTVIPRNVRVSEASSHGQPISRYDARSAGALAYDRLTGEFVARLRAAG